MNTSSGNFGTERKASTWVWVSYNHSLQRWKSIWCSILASIPCPTDVTWAQPCTTRQKIRLRLWQLLQQSPRLATTGLADVSPVRYTGTMVRKTYKDRPIPYTLVMWSKKKTPYSSSFKIFAPESGRVDGVSSLRRGPLASLYMTHLWEFGWPVCRFQIHICRTTRCDTVVKVI